MHTTELAYPPDATDVWDWENVNGEHDGTPRPFRYFIGSSWRVPIARDRWFAYRDYEIAVEIRGRQFEDGRAELWIVTDNVDMASAGGFDLPVPAARMLAESLAAAVAEIERLADDRFAALYELERQVGSEQAERYLRDFLGKHEAER